MRALFDRVLPVLAVVLVLASLWQLEGARRGVEITNGSVGQTPVISYTIADANGPVVVIAHGFAGSAQMMQAYALTLARSGYRVHSFDFLGHGRNPVPMSGDVTVIDGTTRLLVEQTLDVVAAVGDADAPVAVLGHSMATDVLIRAALDDRANIGPLVLLSAFSQAVTETEPADMLLISGQWEGHLRAFGLEAVQMVQPDAVEDAVVQADGVIRMAMAAPYTEHVSILHSKAGQIAARDWLNRAFSHEGAAARPVSGWWLMALLAGIVALARPLARLLPTGARVAVNLPTREVWLLALVPAVSVPVVATYLDVRLLPVMVADYLALHLFLTGMVQLGILWRVGVRVGAFSALGVAAILVWGLGAFGLALDRYGANFVPTSERLWVIAALCIGTLPFMVADALVSRGGDAPLWQRLVLRVAFFASLMWAVYLDFEGLFFLILIAPVMVLFYIVFGLMGRWVAQRAGPLTSGAGLGLILAWALGVSFPFFAVGG
ncbi:alpha/beta fold hydrolase [uncultured Sulfitobacter sp.]|uniref:alpha/beta hydrolase n=1 Tax=uncultured Sulfitobacter sp. TaxID=191468 RepID=UPI00260B0AE7|nr:alpha/beta fold hydrolase [uncultured Sulfitobacter sp.]